MAVVCAVCSVSPVLSVVCAMWDYSDECSLCSVQCETTVMAVVCAMWDYSVGCSLCSANRSHDDCAADYEDFPLPRPGQARWSRTRTLPYRSRSISQKPADRVDLSISLSLKLLFAHWKGLVCLVLWYMCQCQSMVHFVHISGMFQEQCSCQNASCLFNCLRGEGTKPADRAEQLTDFRTDLKILQASLTCELTGKYHKL